MPEYTGCGGNMRPLKGLTSIGGATLAVVLLVGLPATITAQEQRQSPPKFTKPVYNSHTMSYFQLRFDLPTPSTWTNAVVFARTKRFQGVRGRLAVVKDLETHSFLKANFDVRGSAWIGLRYFCSFRKLVWADGTEQPRSKFKMWARKWHRTNIRCGKSGMKFMPVYYTRSAQGFKWQASGSSKQFVSYFVEYRTGSADPVGKKKKPTKKAAPPEGAAEELTKNK